MERLISIRNTINAITSGVGKVASWLTGGLVLLVCGDVIYRRILNDSHAWVGELEWHFFALIFLLASAYALQKDRHVRVDLFYANFSARDKAWVNLIGSALFLIPWCALIIYVSVGFAAQSFHDMEGSPQPGGLPYLWVIKSAIPACFILLLLQAIVEIIDSILVLKKVE
jgi:TRAP-type mannitol/chloroaromatic compound transport system permease small subunit